jgi:hypothetical protein
MLMVTNVDLTYDGLTCDVKFRTKNAFESIDKVLQNFSNINRKGWLLYVEGKLANYKVDIYTCEVTAMCKGNHIHKEICIDLQTQTRFSEDTKLQFKPWNTAIQIAVNLAYDIEVLDLNLLNVLYKLVTCPRCIKDKNIEYSDLIKVCDVMTKREDEESNWRYRDWIDYGNEIDLEEEYLDPF